MSKETKIILGDYKNLTSKKGETVVTKEEIEHEIEHLRHDYAESIIKDGAAENGDVVVIDFDGYLNDKVFDGGKAENYPLELGSGTFIPGFEEQIVGMKKDEEKDINVTFPDDYPSEEVKGKEVVFKIKVHEIKTKKLPELDEEFFKDLGFENVKTKNEFYKEVEAAIMHEKHHQVEDKYIDDLLEELRKNSTIENLDEEFVNKEIDRIYKQVCESVGYQGITMEQYLSFLNKTESEIKESFKEEASKRVSYRLLLEEMAKEENIEATEEEIDNRLEELSRMYEMTKEEINKYFGGRDSVAYDIKMNKAIKLLMK